MLTEYTILGKGKLILKTKEPHMGKLLKVLLLLPFQIIGKTLALAGGTLSGLICTVFRVITGIFSHTLGAIFGGLLGTLKGLFTGLGGSSKRGK